MIDRYDVLNIIRHISWLFKRTKKRTESTRLMMFLDPLEEKKTLFFI